MGWVFDPRHTQVVWEVRYLGLTTIKGSFGEVKAELSMEGSDPAKWSVSAEIDVQSVVSSANPRLPEAIKGPDFLDAERFPTILFRSKRFESDGKHLRVTGDLTLHGVTREVTLVGTDNGDATDRRGAHRRGFDGELVIRRSDYGVPEPSPAGFVGDEVRILVDVQLVEEA